MSSKINRRTVKIYLYSKEIYKISKYTWYDVKIEHTMMVFFNQVTKLIDFIILYSKNK